MCIIIRNEHQLIGLCSCLFSQHFSPPKDKMLWMPLVQRSKGISQLLIYWCLSQMMTNKITPYVYYNWWLKRLDTQLNELTNKNSIKFLKVFKPKNNNYYKTLGTSVLNSPMSPPSLPCFGPKFYHTCNFSNL